MALATTERQFRVSFFDSVAEADDALRRLQSAGFSKAELAVICPESFKDEFKIDVPRAEHPGSHAVEAIVEGGAIGAAIGGLSLVGVAIATGGVGLLTAIPVLIVGGALAGGFSGLILADGYGKEIGENYEEAIRLGKIVVGVKVDGDDSTERLEEAQHIMAEAGGQSPADMAH